MKSFNVLSINISEARTSEELDGLSNEAAEGFKANKLTTEEYDTLVTAITDRRLQIYNHLT